LRDWLDKSNVDVNKQNALGADAPRPGFNDGNVSLCRPLREHCAVVHPAPESRISLPS
jgi:hypothetical protein